MSQQIATLKCCLGLRNKKNTMVQMPNENNFDVLCKQEIDIVNGYPTNILNLPNHELVIEKIGVYIKKSARYVRRAEPINAHLIVVDIEATPNIWLINICRCFNPNEEISDESKLLIQQELISRPITPNVFIIVDFNIGYSIKCHVDYHMRDLFNSFDEILGGKSLLQKLEFHTWPRLCLMYTGSGCWTMFLC
jgi:hypothetical protein